MERRREETEDEAGDSGGEASRRRAAASPKKDRQFVTALARGLAVLRAFSNERRELGSSQIARLTNLPQPTVWRLCKTLLDEGYLLPTQSGEKFQLSPAVLSLGFSALATIPIAEIAKPSMQIVADRFLAGCSLGIRDGNSMLLVQRCQGENATLILNLHVGSRLPLAESAMGTAYIAALDEAEQSELLDHIRSSDELRWPVRKEFIDTTLREYRKYGYIANEAGFHSQLNTVATAFRSSDGRVYSLTCGTPSNKLDIDTMRNEVAPALLQCAKALSGGAAV
ncbi:IclR family transcriptional regulator [Roseitranquillus sediminis]|uniref:IclR family transcriptional regulator n=1 Tax=Roseitranquillus sediminis TaxID=2809051 RepID=UPI001D0C0F3E|nr:IclR family transcriptional regulator [Roseitranquillus sediminis]MBM9594712.1 IclR family transcriptional regulator [Roseitranquillus sediminis]